MQGRFSFEIGDKFVDVDIDLLLEPRKARNIGDLIEADAGATEIDIFSERRRHRVKGTGKVRKMTLRRIFEELVE